MSNMSLNIRYRADIRKNVMCMKKLTLTMLLLAALALPLTGCTGTEQADTALQPMIIRYDEDINISYMYYLDAESYIYTCDDYNQDLVRLVFADADDRHIAWTYPIPDMGGSMFDRCYTAPAQDGLVLRDWGTGTHLAINAQDQTVTPIIAPYEQIYADIAPYYDAEIDPMTRVYYLDGQQWLVACHTHEPGEYHRVTTDFFLWSADSAQKLPYSITGGIVDAAWGGSDNDTLYLLGYHGSVFHYSAATGRTGVINLTGIEPIATEEVAGWLDYSDIMPISGTDDVAALFRIETTDDVVQIFSDAEVTLDDELSTVDGGIHSDGWFTVPGGESQFLGAHTDKIYLLQTYKDNLPEPDKTIESCRIIQYDRTTGKQTIIFDTAGWVLEQPGHLRLYTGCLSPDGTQLMVEGLYHTFSTLSHVDPTEQITLMFDLE